MILLYIGAIGRKSSYSGTTRVNIFWINFVVGAYLQFCYYFYHYFIRTDMVLIEIVVEQVV